MGSTFAIVVTCLYHHTCMLENSISTCNKASLFLSKGAVSYGGSHYGPGMGPVLLNYLGCTGVESNLTDCSHSAFGVVSSACRTHLYDASVFCPTGI